MTVLWFGLSAPFNDEEPPLMLNACLLTIAAFDNVARMPPPPIVTEDAIRLFAERFCLAMGRLPEIATDSNRKSKKSWLAASVATENRSIAELRIDQ